MKAPLRKVLDRRQDFRSTEDFSHGWINETLECGHIHREGIAPDDPVTDVDGHPIRHSHNATRRRCDECVKSARGAA